MPEPIVIEHGCARGAADPLLPQVAKIVDIVEETPDVKSFKLQTLDGKKPFDSKPGQLAMFSFISEGESMFCISGTGDDYVEFTVKRVGRVTELLHDCEVGDQVGLRGPYGNWFPYESCKGRDMLFIGGGIGMPPVRSFLLWCINHREDYGHIDMVYSASTYKDLVCKKDLFENWPKVPDMDVHVSVYHSDGEHDLPESYTAPYLESLNLPVTDNSAAVLCGGPSLYRTCSESLLKMGYAPEQIVTTLEMRMKCGIGKCGRCNIGSHFICLDGPVFTRAEINEMEASA
ncbi:MAG: FAD/NAD(P)-binding protein [Coriobacteriales bacterium]|jgi:NAD(P)H-flavin reductase